MSELDDFISSGVEAAAELFGTVEFTLAGVTYEADLDQSVIERGSLEEGGKAIIRSARLVAQRAQFDAAPKLGARVTVDGQVLRLVHLAKDNAAYTLTLATVAK